MSGLPERQGAMEKVNSMARPQALTPEEALSSFLELQEELPEADSVGQYVLVMRQLVRIKEALRDSPACTKVRTAIRALQERLPQVREKDHHARAIRVNTRIAELEGRAPRCPRGHSMVVRHGPNHGLFWGCTHFPLCHHSKRLATEQRSRKGL